MRDPRPVKQVIEEEGVAAAIGKKHVASVLFTYRCTLACKHCCFNSSPRKPPVFTPLEDALEYLKQLHTTDRVIHIAGGEAMMFFPQLLSICREAGRLGVAPHFIETNATFAVNDEITRDRLSKLKDAGVLGLLISADPFHQLHCPPERYLRCYKIAVEIFGRENVAAGDFDLETLRSFASIARNPERFRDYVLRHPPMLVGRAGNELASLFPDRPIHELLDGMWHGGEGRPDCSLEFHPDTMWEIHIDPYGNIQTCCGIILGNAKETPLPQLMQTGFLGRSPIIDAVFFEGPTGLLKMAVERGYTPKPGYPQKCGLCWEVRKFLRPYFPEVLGPDEVYVPD
jgi:hypothetical protein